MVRIVGVSGYRSKRQQEREAQEKAASAAAGRRAQEAEASKLGRQAAAALKQRNVAPNLVYERKVLGATVRSSVWYLGEFSRPGFIRGDPVTHRGSAILTKSGKVLFPRFEWERRAALPRYFGDAAPFDATHAIPVLRAIVAGAGLPRDRATAPGWTT